MAMAKDEFGRTVGHYAAQANTVRARGMFSSIGHRRCVALCWKLIWLRIAAFVYCLLAFTPWQVGLKTSIISDRDQKGDTPLMEAAWHGHEQMVRLLEYSGAKIKTANHFHETALHRATRGSRLPIIDYLIRGDMEKRGRDDDDGDHPATFTRMLDPVFINAQNKNGETALHIAAANGDMDAVDIILGSGGADTTLMDNKGRTAKRIAQEGFCGETYMVFVAYKIDA